MNYLVIGLVILNLILTYMVFIKKTEGVIDIWSNIEKPFRELFEVTFRGYFDSAQRSHLDALERQETKVLKKFDDHLEAIHGNARLSRQDAANSKQELEDALKSRLSENTESIGKLTEANESKFKDLRETVDKQMTALREENEKKLEAMRATVEEKLQETLEKRIGSSFQTVQELLEKVHKGLGEMTGLASDVGNLGRVLTNVKNRGSWGEMQLGRQLEDMLQPGLYEANVKINPTSREVVEYAVKLPGQVEGEVVYLPIDSKFPQEDYERLLNAQEVGIKEQVEAQEKALEKAIKTQAATIAEKYILPPTSTDFAIMYLPTEGLFAEAVRRPGLISELQTKYHVTVMGPTTLMAFLNSLQMGFRTLAIEKSSSEVWHVLGAAKSEFQKYGKVWEKLEKQLSTAQKTVDDAGKRTRVIQRQLKNVSEFDAKLLPGFTELENYTDEEDEVALEDNDE